MPLKLTATEALEIMGQAEQEFDWDDVIDSVDILESISRDEEDALQAVILSSSTPEQLMYALAVLIKLRPSSGWLRSHLPPVLAKGATDPDRADIIAGMILSAPDPAVQGLLEAVRLQPGLSWLLRRKVEGRLRYFASALGRSG